MSQRGRQNYEITVFVSSYCTHEWWCLPEMSEHAWHESAAFELTANQATRETYLCV